jgi:hypothetical protein
MRIKKNRMRIGLDFCKHLWFVANYHLMMNLPWQNSGQLFVIERYKQVFYFSSRSKNNPGPLDTCGRYFVGRVETLAREAHPETA